MKNFLTFLLVFIITFFVVSLSLVVYNYIPFIDIVHSDYVLKQFVKGLLLPAFYSSLFHSMLISMFFYSCIFVNSQGIKKVLQNFIPVIFQIVIIIVIFFVLRPGEKELGFFNYKDARLFLVEDSFMPYKPHIPQVLKNYQYQNIISDLEGDDREKFEKFYSKNLTNNDYVLDILTERSRLELERILLDSEDAYSDKLYFGKVNADSFENVIHIRDGVAYSDKTKEVNIIDDKILIELDSGRVAAYPKKQLMQLEWVKLEAGIFLIREMKKMISKYFDYRDLSYDISLFPFISIIILWLVTGFFVTTLGGLIRVDTFPLLSLVLNIILIGMFYISVNFTFFMVNYLQKSFLPDSFILADKLIVSVLLFIPVLIINMIYLLTKKTDRRQM